MVSQQNNNNVISFQVLATVITFSINVAVLIWGASKLATNLEHTQTTVTEIVRVQTTLAEAVSSLTTQIKLQEYRLYQLENNKGGKK